MLSGVKKPLSNKLCQNDANLKKTSFFWFKNPHFKAGGRLEVKEHYMRVYTITVDYFNMADANAQMVAFDSPVEH
jgi:hypothetical protein